MTMKRTTLLLMLLCLCMVLTACGETETPTDAPEGCLRAGNEATDFTFCYPNTWQLDRNDGMIAVKTNVGSSGTKAYASVSVMAFTLEDSGQGAANFWDKHKTDLTDTYGRRSPTPRRRRSWSWTATRLVSAAIPSSFPT